MLSACVKDRIPAAPNQEPIEPVGDVFRHMLFINEFIASGSLEVNEFGNTADWVELFNPSFSEVTLEAGHWFISDGGPDDPKKYELPPLSFAPRSFLLIWCDNMDVVEQDIHTNFALSSAGEHLVLYYENDAGQGLMVDDYSFGAQDGGISEGRLPDGGAAWNFFTIPSPGASNQ